MPYLTHLPRLIHFDPTCPAGHKRGRFGGAVEEWSEWFKWGGASGKAGGASGDGRLPTPTPDIYFVVRGVSSKFDLALGAGSWGVYLALQPDRSLCNQNARFATGVAVNHADFTSIIN